MATSGTYSLSGAGTLAANLSGLLPGTTYSIGIRSFNGTTFSPANADIVVATTLSDGLQPTDPIELRVKRDAPSTPSTVTLTWQPADQNGGSSISGYEVTWDPPYGAAQPKIVFPGAALPYATVITDLEPNSRFTFTVKTINEDGSSSPGNASVFAATALSNGWFDIRNFRLDSNFAPTSNAIGLRWSGGDCAPFRQADMSYHLITWQPPDGGGFVYTANKFAGYKIITGLEPDTTYSFNIVLIDKSGGRSPGNYYISGSTTSLGGLQAPLNLEQDGQATQSAVSMTWIPAVATAPDVVECNVVTAYDISEDYYLAPQTLSGGITSNYTYTNLSAGTDYRFTLVAFSAGFSAQCVTTFDATTSVSGGPADPILSLTSIAYNNAAFSWDLSGNGRNGGANLSGYFIEYYPTADGPETALTKNPAGSLANRSAVIFGLTADTAYTFKVYAINLSGRTSAGGIESTLEASTLPLGSPFTPSNLQVHPFIPVTDSTITVMWNTAYQGPAENSDVTDHIVDISPAPENEQTTFIVGLNTTLTISYLTAEQEYYIRVKAINADLVESPWSGSLVVTTAPVDGPGDPAGLRTNGIVDSTSIPLAWASSADELGGAAIEGYQIEYQS
jgi:hypothetical protein